jgi:DNA-binding NtrC family response regulator
VTLILVVEDEQTQAEALKGHLEEDGHQVVVCADGEQALDKASAEFGVILSDMRLPDMDGLEIFHRVHEEFGDDAPAFVILTAYGTVESARDALKAGVFDYLTKPVNPTELTFLIKNIMDQRRLRQENLELTRAVGQVDIGERMIGHSESFREMLELAGSAAESEATILIRGESGTGKELVAEFIHHHSPRRDGPFVRVNCGAIPETLLESELFGHERGAFTDAHRARKGRFELAHGGTIFLDEIAEMSPALQVKLLRVLQERELERLGGQGQVIPLDIRLVAATNRNLEVMVKEQAFREDLYYRVNVITIDLPPLRDRVGDVELLAENFCARFTRKNQRSFRGISPAALERLAAHSWPGNVRELENVLERAVVLGRGDWILPDHLADFDQPRMAASSRPATRDELVQFLLHTDLGLDDLEAKLIERALRRTEGNVTQAARILGLTRRTLQYRMEKHGVSRGEQVG